ncbi:MAG: hypothetical protein JWN73_2865 [Betaproteobacteria bacterium]|nr:hypothetical protein [Betaproteobacteria bacterium]
MSDAETAQLLTRPRAALAEHRAGELPAGELAQTLRGETALLARLPPRYAQALNEILLRLESAALFSEESCSFSQRDLVEALEDWLARAQQQLQAGGAAKSG